MSIAPRMWSSPEARDARNSMPEYQGKIQDPRYVPEHHRDEYIKAWGIWLRAHAYREPWMRDFIAYMKRKARPTSAVIEVRDE